MEEQKDLPLPQKDLPEPQKLLNPPTFREKYLSSKWYVLALATILVLLFGGSYFFGDAVIKTVLPTTTPTPSTEVSITPTSDPMQVLQTYTDNQNDFSFTYPSIIDATTKTPKPFEVVLPENQPHLRIAGKMFNNCDLYFIFKKTHGTALIAMDVSDSNSNSNHCWSYGYFKEDSTRKIDYLPNTKVITRYKWRNPFGKSDDEKTWEDNWEGDYFQSVSVESPNKTISFALMNQMGYRDETEKIFDSIVSSLKFLKRSSPTPTLDQVVCTMDAKLCPDGSSVGRVGPNCEFAPCP